ncbi:MAG: ComEC/Rec2 family competence protein, partial [Planctomycetota bacterium]
DTSLVLRVRCDNKSVLLTGDLGETAQRELIAGGKQIAADALVLPHHGGWEESLPEFVSAVDPQVVLVSNSRDYSGAGDDHRGGFYTRIRTAYRYYSTGGNGYIRLRFGAGKLDTQTMR